MCPEEEEEEADFSCRRCGGRYFDVDVGGFGLVEEEAIVRIF